MRDLLNLLQTIKENTLENYIVPGLDSSLIQHGRVRVFEMSRQQHEHITPHSHRFDLACIVMTGHVDNTTWRETDLRNGDAYCKTELVPSGEFGRYTFLKSKDSAYASQTTRHTKGDFYYIPHGVIHSIQFSKDASVLLIESKQKSDSSYILEPIVKGVRIPTFETKPFMFQVKV